MALGRHHVQALTTARDERLELLQGRVRQRPRRGVHPFRKERQEMRIQAVRFRELSGGFGEVADLTRIRHHHGKAGGGQGGDERSFVAPGGFEVLTTY